MAISTARIRTAVQWLAHALCLLPALRLTLQAFGVGGMDLGPDPVERLLHALGWWGLTLLLATLAVTPLRQLLRQPWLHQLRRPLGLYSFFYAAMHFVVYAALDRELRFDTIGEDIAKRPFILVGTLSLLMLVPLAITSTKSWIRRMGRRWRTLHLLVYPAAALAVAHFYWQVKQDIREPVIFGVILAALFAYRVVAGRPRKAESTTAR